jgi:hypothetical protein
VTVLPITATFVSVASHDGWLRESRTQADVGEVADSNDSNSYALRIGDEYDRGRRVEPQLKSIVSFNTAAIPDGADIQSATLRLVRGRLEGVNPFTTHAPCYLDIVTGSFSGNAVLEIQDFQAIATAQRVATMSNPPNNGSQSIGALNAAGRAAINKVGLTQLKIYFAVDDNDDMNADATGFYSGENAVVANRPVLEVTYLP